MQELLTQFVTVADEVGRLQRGGDAECDLFNGFCEEGHYGGRAKPTNTRQGIYAIAPSGKFLASINTTDADRMAAMLQQAMQRWRELPAAERQLDAEQVRRLGESKRFEDRYPQDGLVLAEYMRDLDVVGDDNDWLTRAANEDQAWFRKEEAASMVPASHDVGAHVELPSRLVDRLVLLHLVDSVRGQAPSFPKEALVEASLRSEVTAVAEGRVHLRLSGKSKTAQKGKWRVEDRGDEVEHGRGIDVQFEGRAVWHVATQRFEAFALLATGMRHGATQYNQRGNDAAPKAIGFAFVLATATHPRVAPAFWWEYGWR